MCTCCITSTAVKRSGAVDCALAGSVHATRRPEALAYVVTGLKLATNNESGPSVTHGLPTLYNTHPAKVLGDKTAIEEGTSPQQRRDPVRC